MIVRPPAIALVIQNGLSFLGFGVVLPNPELGRRAGEASQVLLRSPWLLVAACGVVGLTVLAFVLLGNATRDAWTRSLGPVPASRTSGGVLTVRGLSVVPSFSIGRVVVVVGETGCGKERDGAGCSWPA